MIGLDSTQLDETHRKLYRDTNIDIFSNSNNISLTTIRKAIQYGIYRI